MKRIYIWLSLLLPVLFITSCNSSSLLDREDIGDLEKDDVFQNPTYARYFIDDIYYYLPNGYQVSSSWYGAYLDCATDNGEARHLDSDAHKFNEGSWNANNLPLDGLWSKCYAEIRACNRFIENYFMIEPIEGIATQDDIKRLYAEAIFLRAFYYAELLKNFGGVPLVDYVPEKADDVKSLERMDYSELVDWVVGQCDTAIALFQELPVSADDNYGRADDGAAMALKARVLLFAASPLFNRPADYPQYDSADPNLTLWRYGSYDKERWLRAAQAAKAIVESGRYSLFNEPAGTKTAYETYFVTRYTPTETIFPVLRGPSIEIYYNNLPFDFLVVKGKGSPMAYNLPTQDLVSSYEMQNGMLPEQDGSGYRPLDPFSGRDPRLNATIWHDESKFCNIEFQTWRRETGSSKSDGKDYIRGYSRTGFFLRKFMDVDLNPTNSVTLPNCYPLFRYADVLLSYAEALNEYYDSPAEIPDNAAIAAIDKVRSRAGMPGVEETFANRGWDLTKENLRKLIQNERRVEFAFEEHRFYDIRRWMIGTQTQKSVHECEIILSDDDYTKTYNVRQIEKRAYEDYMNLMPLPQNECNRNQNLVQNFGWSPANQHE